MKKLIAVLSLTVLCTVLFVPSLSAGEKPSAQSYPLTNCPVSGEKLDSMGKPFIYNYEGREVRFCCKNCVKDFRKEPAKYLKVLDDAAKK